MSRPPFLHAGTVVPEDVNNERIVAEAHVFDRLQDASDSVVSVFLVTCIDLPLTRIHLLYVRRYAVPRWERRIARRQFGVGRNHTELFLPCERLFAQLVPTLKIGRA